MSEKRPTILQIIPEIDAGGAERTTIEVADAIVKAGGRAIVLSQGGRLEADLAAAGGEHIAFAAATKNPLRMLANARAITRLVEREGVDLVHARSRAPAWSAFLAARRTRLPFVTTYHGIYNEKGRAKRAYNSVMAKGDIVIANSDYTAEVVRARYGIEPDHLVVINRGVDIDRFDRAGVTPERITALRTVWGVAAEERIVLHAARLTRWKGQGTVIAAAARLAREPRFDDTVFVLAGDAQGRDDYVAGLDAEIAAHRLGNRVRLVGHVEDMPAAVAASDIVLVASIEPEAFGRTSVEAQAMGVPVIATSIGAPQSTVLAPPAHADTASTGRLVPPGDGAALAKAVSDLLSLSDQDRLVMSGNAASHARTNYTTRKLQLETLAVYDRLLGAQLSASFRAATG